MTIKIYGTEWSSQWVLVITTYLRALEDIDTKLVNFSRAPAHTKAAFMSLTRARVVADSS